jgi:hypothetical protein
MGNLLTRTGYAGFGHTTLRDGKGLVRSVAGDGFGYSKGNTFLLTIGKERSLMSDTTARTGTSVLPDDPEQLLTLYRHGGNLELALQREQSHDGTTPLTSEQVGDFNHLLRTARELLPNSKALREDVEEIGARGMNAASAYRALRVTILPALHNALPEDYASR